MSWSLEIRNGDLTLSGARYGGVTGAAKLVQDFRAQLLERMGTDPQHPEYGSLINGGRTPDGREHPGAIGQTTNSLTILDVRTEIIRIAQNIQSRQLAKARADRIKYGKVTLRHSEVLYSLRDVNIRQDEDSLIINITLVTADGTVVEPTIAISNPVSIFSE